MNRVIVIFLVFVCMTSQMRAQALSEEVVSAKMTQALELSEAGKKAEALELFLIVGENTKPQRNESERQVYVLSQSMACMCYRDLGKYGDAYLLAKSLLQGKLSDEERKDVSYLYVMNGYFHACGFIQRDGEERLDYRRGRSILEEIKPYAEGRLRDYVFPKIPLSWYYEGMQCSIMQKL